MPQVWGHPATRIYGETAVTHLPPNRAEPSAGVEPLRPAPPIRHDPNAANHHAQAPPERATGLSTTVTTMAMPIAFTAFCELHHDRYLRYARLRITDPRAAEHAVQATFGDLALHWPHILRSANLTAYAWSVLKLRITETLRACHGHAKDRDQVVADEPASQAIRRVRVQLPENQADIAALHYLLHLSPTEIAQIIGADRDTVNYHLSKTRHELPDLLIHPAQPTRT